MSMEQESPIHHELAATHVTAGTTCDLDDAPNGEVRRLVRDLLDGRTDPVAEDAVLVADELVSNALQHGAAPRTCRVMLLDDGWRLRIEVDDASPHMPTVRTPDQYGRRGLVLVERLASSWGVREYAHHKTVWAELELDRPEPTAAGRHLTVVRDGS